MRSGAWRQGLLQSPGRQQQGEQAAWCGCWALYRHMTLPISPTLGRWGGQCPCWFLIFPVRMLLMFKKCNNSAETLSLRSTDVSELYCGGDEWCPRLSVRLSQGASVCLWTARPDCRFPPNLNSQLSSNLIRHGCRVGNIWGLLVRNQTPGSNSAASRRNWDQMLSWIR